MFGKRAFSLVVGLVFLAACLAAAGCVPKKTGPSQVPSPAPSPARTDTVKPVGPPALEHTVKWSGETLGIISKWYTGSTANWEAISKANPEIKPNRIRLGDKILIPGALVKNREPMPREFTGRSGRKGQKAAGKETPGESPEGAAAEEAAPPAAQEPAPAADESQKEAPGVLFGPKGYEE
jgi:hypothetical protein